MNRRTVLFTRQPGQAQRLALSASHRGRRPAQLKCVELKSPQGRASGQATRSAPTKRVTYTASDGLTTQQQKKRTTNRSADGLIEFD
jgi:hypothetical protein